jgi:hypothetical protein
MIMSGRDSALFSLNETAALLWQAADGTTPLAEIVQLKICPAFEVNMATAMDDAKTLAMQLAEHGILRISDQPMTNSDPARGS